MLDLPFLKNRKTCELEKRIFGGEQDYTPLDSTTEYGDRRHVHEESVEAMPATEAATHAAMRDHTFQVTNDDHAPQTAH